MLCILSPLFIIVTIFVQKKPQENRIWMKTKLYLDRRQKNRKGAKVANDEKEYPIKVSINCRSSSAYIATGFSVREECWDPSVPKITRHPNAARLNIKLQEKKIEVDRIIEDLREEGVLHGATAAEIKAAVERRKDEEKKGGQGKERKVVDCFREYIGGINRRGTARVYERTLVKLLQYKGFRDSMTFRDITVGWLYDFESHLEESLKSANARGIHLRNMRAIFNYAITEGYTKAQYPFRRFKIKSDPTKDRSLTVEELRAFFAAPCSPSQEKYRDIFRLSFLLCGINLEDLLELRSLNGGRVDVLRIKTRQPLNMMVPPEAMEIFEKYKGKDYLLDVSDRCGNYKNYLHRLNDNIQRIGMNYNPHLKKWEGKPVLPEVSYYCARYTWATLAAELDIPERTIGYALGHSTAKTVTSIYTRVDMRKKVDAANRKVIDFVFGGER